jgi:hypothetical protein
MLLLKGSKQRTSWSNLLLLIIIVIIILGDYVAMVKVS